MNDSCGINNIIGEIISKALSDMSPAQQQKLAARPRLLQLYLTDTIRWVAGFDLEEKFKSDQGIRLSVDFSPEQYKKFETAPLASDLKEPIYLEDIDSKDKFWRRLGGKRHVKSHVVHPLQIYQLIKEYPYGYVGRFNEDSKYFFLCLDVQGKLIVVELIWSEHYNAWCVREADSGPTEGGFYFTN